MVKNILESVTLGVEAYLKEVPITDSKENRCYVFVNAGLESFRMLTVIKILASLHNALSTCKKTISNVILNMTK